MSSAYGALTTALRMAEAHGLPVEEALIRLAPEASIAARDVASVLHARITMWTEAAVRSGRAHEPALVAGLLPAAAGDVPPDFGVALQDRARLMEERVDELLARAECADAPWLRRLDPRPAVGLDEAAWQRARRAVAAYRDRYGVCDVEPLGPGMLGDEHRAEAQARCQALIGSHAQAPPAAQRSSTDPAARVPLARPVLTR